MATIKEKLVARRAGDTSAVSPDAAKRGQVTPTPTVTGVTVDNVTTNTLISQGKLPESERENIPQGATPTPEDKFGVPTEIATKLESAAAVEKTRTEKLTDLLEKKPEETAVQRLQRLNEERGRPALIQTRQDVLKSVTEVNALLRGLEDKIQKKGQDVGITQAQAGRLGTQERKPLTRELEALNDTLRLTNQSVSDIDDTVAQLTGAARQDQADELQRLTKLASVPGITDTEKELLSLQIKQYTEGVKAKAESGKKRRDTFEKSLNSIRNFTLTKGITTGAFNETVKEAQRRFALGEDPLTILTDVSAAVASNPQLQAKLRKGGAAAKPEFTATQTAKAKKDIFGALTGDKFEDERDNEQTLEEMNVIKEEIRFSFPQLSEPEIDKALDLAGIKQEAAKSRGTVNKFFRSLGINVL